MIKIRPICWAISIFLMLSGFLKMASNPRKRKWPPSRIGDREKIDDPEIDAEDGHEEDEDSINPFLACSPANSAIQDGAADASCAGITP